MPNFIRWLNDREKKDKPIDIGATSDFARSPYAGLCPADYKVPDKLSTLQTKLDQHIKELCEKGAVDAGNDTAADDYISSGIAVCAEEINYQRAERQRIIIGLVSRWKGDLIDGQLKIEDFQKELEEIEKELSNVKELLHAKNDSKHNKRHHCMNDPSSKDATESEITEVKRNAS
jgi:hypothetical protein